MAVNINAGTQRHENNPNENFAEVADQNTQQNPGSQPQLSQQSGSNADSQSAPEPVAPPEEAAQPPAFARYGIGDTIIMSRPDYARAYADRAQQFEGEPNPRDTAFAPQPQAVANLSKPIPMPKPGGTVALGAPELLPPPSSSVSAPYSSLFVPGNAAWQNEFGGVYSETVYPPAAPTRDATLLADANAYAEAHGLSSQDAAKLAALMANNHSPGQEWLSLRPEVLASVLDAISINPDGSFDVSGVFGGALGYYDARINTPIDARLDENGNVVTETGTSESSNLTPIHREGWSYQAGADGGPGTYRASDATLARYNAPYQPMLDAGFQQVNRNYTNDSVLSVGAEGGYRDLSQLEFNPIYGLVSPSSNYIPVDSTDWADVAVPALVFAAAGAGVASFAGLGVAGSAAAGSFVSTLGTTLDLNAAFRAGAIGFVAAGFAEWLTPQLMPGVPAESVIRQGVQSLISGTTAGALQGDIRQGFINGVTSFISLQIASGLDIPRPLASALIRSFSDPDSALTGLLADVVTAAVTDGAQGIVAENDIVDRLMQDQPGLTPEQARMLAQTMLATGREIRDINNGSGAANTNRNIVTPAFDDDGNLMPGAVDATKPLAQQQAQLETRLRQQGMSAADAARTAGNWFQPEILAQTVYRNQPYRPLFDDDGNLMPGAVDTSKPIEQIRAEIAGQLIARGVAPNMARQIAHDVDPNLRYLPIITVTASGSTPFTTGSELVDQIWGGIQGALITGRNVVFGNLQGIVDIGRIPFDGVLDMVNLALPETMFADSAARNAARIDLFNNLIANIQNLPSALQEHFNGRLDRANQLDAAGDYIGAARERTELVGEIITSIVNPRSPSMARVLERLGIDPVVHERSSQAQSRFRLEAIEHELRVNPNFANVDASLYQAHHTIPMTQFSELGGLRARLQQWGIDINNVEHNSVMLPKPGAPTGLPGVNHGSLGNAGYAEALERRFIGVNDAAAARRELAAINNELRNGTFLFTPK